MIIETERLILRPFVESDAADERLGHDFKKRIKPLVNEDGTVDARMCTCAEVEDCILCFEVKTGDGAMKLIDYSSAGKDHGKLMAAWLPADE